MAHGKTPLDEQLEAALRAATDDAARYHIRQALQIQIAKQAGSDSGSRAGL